MKISTTEPFLHNDEIVDNLDGEVFDVPYQFVSFKLTRKQADNLIGRCCVFVTRIGSIILYVKYTRIGMEIFLPEYVFKWMLCVHSSWNYMTASKTISFALRVLDQIKNIYLSMRVFCAESCRARTGLSIIARYVTFFLITLKIIADYVLCSTLHAKIGITVPS